MAKKDNELALLGGEPKQLPAERQATYLDVIKEKDNQIVQSGRFKGMDRAEARELQSIETPTSILLPEVDEDGRYNLINRSINEVLLSLPREEVAPANYEEFPSSVKHNLMERLRSYGMISALILGPILIGVPWVPLVLVWLAYSVLTGLASLGFYTMFRNKDYVVLKGIVTSVQENGHWSFNWMRGRYKRSYIVTMLTVNDDLLSFTYPYYLGKQELKGLPANTPISVFVRKGTGLVDSPSGLRLEDVVGIEIGEASLGSVNDLGESYTVEDFV